MLTRFLALLTIATVFLLNTSTTLSNVVDVSLCGAKIDDVLPAGYNGLVAYIPSDSYTKNNPIVRIQSGQTREEISIPANLSDTIRLRSPRLSPDNAIIVMRPRPSETALILWNIRTGDIRTIELDADVAFYLTGENESRTGRSYPPFTTAVEWIDASTLAIKIPVTTGVYTQFTYRLKDGQVYTTAPESTTIQDITTNSVAMSGAVTSQADIGSAMQFGYLRIVESVSGDILYSEPNRYRGDLQKIGGNFIIYTVSTENNGIQPVLLDIRLGFPQQNKLLNALIKQFGQTVVSSGATPSVDSVTGRIALAIGVRQLEAPAIDVLTVYNPYLDLLDSYCVDTLNFSLLEFVWLDVGYLAIVRYGSPMTIYDLQTGDTYRLNGDLLNY